MNATLSAILAAGSKTLTAGDASAGKWVFVAALGLLLAWLVCMPRQLIGQAEEVPPWWRNVRFWAIVVCAIQMGVYAYFG